MPLDTSKLFLFNSGLPEAGQSSLDFSHLLGPWQSNFRGRNNGNGYITHAMLRGLFGKALRLDHVANGWTADLSDEFIERINQNYSHLIFIMQDFIRESFATQAFGKLADFLEKITIPVVPISLGANAFSEDAQLHQKLSPDQIRFLKVVSEKSKFVGVRGAYTAEVLKHLGITNVTITGCPSFFENGAALPLVRRDFDSTRVITTGTFFHRGLSQAPHILQDEMFFINALYLAHGSGEVRLDDSPEAAPYDPGNLDSTFSLYERAMSGRLRFFSSFDVWRRYYLSEPWSLTVGSRLHSAIQSWNSGVPAIVTNFDARARETCETHGMPYMPSLNADSDIQAAFEAMNVDLVAATYPKGRKTYLDYMAAHGIAPSDDDASGEIFTYPEYEHQQGEASRDILRRGYYETWDYTHNWLRNREVLQEALNESVNTQVTLSTTISSLNEHCAELSQDVEAARRERDIQLEINNNLNTVVAGLTQKDDASAGRFESVSSRLDDLREFSGISFINFSERLATLEAGFYNRAEYEKTGEKITALTVAMNNIVAMAHHKGLIANRIEFDGGMSIETIKASGHQVMDALKTRRLW